MEWVILGLIIVVVVIAAYVLLRRQPGDTGNTEGTIDHGQAHQRDAAPQGAVDPAGPVPPPVSGPRDAGYSGGGPGGSLPADQPFDQHADWAQPDARGRDADPAQVSDGGWGSDPGQGQQGGQYAPDQPHAQEEQQYTQNEPGWGSGTGDGSTAGAVDAPAGRAEDLRDSRVEPAPEPQGFPSSAQPDTTGEGSTAAAVDAPAGGVDSTPTPATDDTSWPPAEQVSGAPPRGDAWEAGSMAEPGAVPAPADAPSADPTQQQIGGFHTAWESGPTGQQDAPVSDWAPQASAPVADPPLRSDHPEPRTAAEQESMTSRWDRSGDEPADETTTVRGAEAETTWGTGDGTQTPPAGTWSAPEGSEHAGSTRWSSEDAGTGLQDEPAYAPAQDDTAAYTPAQDQTTYAPAQDDTAAYTPAQDDTAAYTPAQDDTAAYTPAQEQAPEPRQPDEPYGPGSSSPDAEGNGPAGWAIKGNAGSMLFHTIDSPSYEQNRAEVWFESEDAARAAGFAHWDRRRR